MSVRAMISFDVMKEDRLYHVLVPNGSPFQEAKDALHEVLFLLETQEKVDKEKAEQKEAAQAEEASQIEEASQVESPEIVA